MSVVLVVLAGLMPGQVHAGSRVELRSDWYSIVEPYRYVEARRFERGWNRGADVTAVDGVVRSPVDGVVRFRGWVAGRLVVTVATKLDGRDIVLTVTGLDSSAAQVGVQVGAGDVLGAGTSMQVGAYDATRRSRYVPVVSTGNGGGGGAQLTGDDTLSGRITDRLRTAIEGRAGNADVRPAAAVVGTGPPTGAAAPTGALPGSTAGLRRPPTQATAGVSDSDAQVLRSPRVLELLPIELLRTDPSRAARFADGRNDGDGSSQVHRAGGRSPSLDARGLGRAARVGAFSMRTAVAAPTQSDDRGVTHALHLEAPAMSSGDAPIVSTPVAAFADAQTGSSSPVTVVRRSGHRHTRTLTADASSPDDAVSHGPVQDSSRTGGGGSWVRVAATGAALAIVAVLAMLRGRRRRARRLGDPGSVIHDIAPPLVPAGARRRELVAGRDERLVPEPRVSFAWTDVESGTSHTIDVSTDAHRVRSPEHA